EAATSGNVALPIYIVTGCKFCREHTLLSLALVEVQNKGRVWCRQKNVRKVGGAMMTKCACSLPVLFVLSSGLLATYACIFFHYFNSLWQSAKLATSYIGVTLPKMGFGTPSKGLLSAAYLQGVFSTTLPKTSLYRKA